MSKQNKQGVALLAILVMGFILGLLFAPPTTVTVEKQVDRVVEKPVEKIVEVESQECKNTKHNYDISQQIIQKKNDGIIIISELLTEIEYYINNQDEFNDKLAEVEKITNDLKVLEAQYK